MAAPCLVSHLGENKSKESFSTNPSNGHSSPLEKTDREDKSGFGLKETTVVLGSAGVLFSSSFLFFKAEDEEISVEKLNLNFDLKINYKV